MPDNHYKPVGRQQDVVVQEFYNEVLIYDLKANKAFSLNQSSALIWRLLDGSRTVSDIAGNLSGRFDSPVTEDFVWLALEQLKRDHLLENPFITTLPFNGLSRREVIRKVGFASLVALPIITSLVAPTAAHAQSSCFGNNNARQSANNCGCDSASDCQSNCCGSNGVTATCVTAGLDADGSACRAGCECASTCCASNTCFALKALPATSPCSSACQCQNTCSGGFCT